jgi:hypothetical protein
VSRPNANLAANWRATITAGGTPGTTDATTFTGLATADDDLDGLSALLEYALGSSDAIPTIAPLAVVLDGPSIAVSLITHSAAEDIQLSPEISTTLTAWQPAAASPPFTTGTGTPGKVRTTWQITPPPGASRAFVRISASLASP